MIFYSSFIFNIYTISTYTHQTLYSIPFSSYLVLVLYVAMHLMVLMGPHIVVSLASQFSKCGPRIPGGALRCLQKVPQIQTYLHNNTKMLYCFLPFHYVNICTDGAEAMMGENWHLTMNQCSGTKLHEHHYISHRHALNRKKNANFT